MRRFDLKARLDYLAADQAWALLGQHVAALGLDPPDSRDRQHLAGLECLTPGDFAGVARQHRFRPLASASDLVDALKREHDLRQTSRTRSIGFLRQQANGGRDMNAVRDPGRPIN
jgi:transitional endoplasmic reticulum ATPase